jgi:hypothetical protein
MTDLCSGQALGDADTTDKSNPYVAFLKATQKLMTEVITDLIS